MSEIIIAIDGPAGAGKSTVAKALCARLGLKLLDTGAMYRCVALTAQQTGIANDDVQNLTRIASDINIQFEDGEPQRVKVSGADVTDQIRTLEIGQLASQISTIPEVRQALVAKQQEIIATGGFVLEGRDVTTVVAPGADLKIFLTASIEERGRRRWVEITKRGEATRLQDVVKDVVERDHRDYTRKDSPLTLAEDAVIVESYGISVDEVVSRIIAYTKK